MKQSLTFHAPVLASTESQINVEAFDQSNAAFDKGEYLQSFYFLLDYLNPDFRKKYGNATATEFKIPHGSIVVNLCLDDKMLHITAPFLELPEKGTVAMLRQVAELNTSYLDIAQFILKDNKLSFVYECPIELVNPTKLYFVLRDICSAGDKYDDEFVAKFGAKRIYEPIVKPYDAETFEKVYAAIQLSCSECLDVVKEFESERKYGSAWNVIATTLLEIFYFANPQGQLFNDLNKIYVEHDRDDIPVPELVIRGREAILKLQQMSREKIAEDLYFVEVFVSNKRRSNLSNIQQNIESGFDYVKNALESNNYEGCYLKALYELYTMYYYNNVQEDVNRVVAKALQDSSARPIEEAAQIMHRVMERIMEDELEEEYDDEEEEQEEEGNSIQANIEESMKAYLENVQNMMSSMFKKTK